MCYHSFSPFSLKYCTGLYNLNILLYKGLIESTLPFGIYNTIGVFHNRNPSNLDSSDQWIHLFCDLNLNLDYESVDLPLEVDQQIQCPWITHNSLKNNCSNM